jgi:ABC-type Fe3+ transport system permease subunit
MGFLANSVLLANIACLGMCFVIGVNWLRASNLPWLWGHLLWFCAVVLYTLPATILGITVFEAQVLPIVIYCTVILLINLKIARFMGLIETP